MEAVERFKLLFRGRENCHGRYIPATGTRTKRVLTKKEPPPERMWQDHLDGKGPFLGVSPIRQDNSCYFGAIDLDDDNTDHALLERRVRDMDLPLVVVRSKSGGCHLYVFLANPAPASLVNKKLTEWHQALKLQNPTDAKGRRPSLEVFPKQVKIKPDDVGNWINLPYYHAKDTERYAVIGGRRATLDEFLAYAEENSLTTAGLEVTDATEDDSTSVFKDGPPCLITLGQRGFGEGERNQGLYNVGIFLKLKHPDDWQDRLYAYNDTIDEPLPEEEVAPIVRSLEKKEYVYKCGDLPISEYCQKNLCKKQKFGIDAFRQREIEGNLPSVSGLQKIMTDPPYWSLEVDGTRLTMGTEDFMNLSRFRKIALEKCNIIIPMIKAHEWDKVLRGLMEEVDIINAPADAGVLGQFKFLVSEFLELRRKSENRESLLLGKPYQENGKVLFRSTDLVAFLERRRFREYSKMSDIYGALRSMGAGHDTMNIKGACVQVWHLPAPEDEVNQELTLPKHGDQEF